MQLFYDPYDWSFPPDIILHGLFMKPSLTDLGLDDTWDHEDPANLSKVLKKLSYMMQVKYHHTFPLFKLRNVFTKNRQCSNHFIFFVIVQTVA